MNLTVHEYELIIKTWIIHIKNIYFSINLYEKIFFSINAFIVEQTHNESFGETIQMQLKKEIFFGFCTLKS